MFRVELTQDDLNTLGTCIDVTLKNNGVAMIDELFLVLTKLRTAVPVNAKGVNAAIPAPKKGTPKDKE